MVNIDYIMDLFDWTNSKENQEKGLALAKNVRSINVFMRPADSEHCKNVWDNCALVLADRSDEELKPYFYNMMCWPGAFIILERLKKCVDKDDFRYIFDICIREAKLLRNDSWERNLHLLGGEESLRVQEIEKLQEKSKKDFMVARTQEHLQNYMMSLLIPEFQDYEQAVDLAIYNRDLIMDLRLCFLAAHYFTVVRKENENPFLDQLNALLASVEISDQAIIYYLNAYHLQTRDPSRQEDIRDYLERSVKCSENMKFVWNRWNLSYMLSGTRSIQLREEAKSMMAEQNKLLRENPIEYWLDIDKWIGRCILGTEI